MTNGDVIRKATDKELYAEYLSEVDCLGCMDIRCVRDCQRWRSGGGRSQACADTWLEWLGKEEEA